MTVDQIRELQQTIVERLKSVIDPETGADVMRMRLVENITADAQGRVSYTFHPSHSLSTQARPLPFLN